MKYLPFLLLMPIVALAQPPIGQMDPQQIFENTKKTMLPLMEETLPTMREARSCLQGADDQAAFEKCADVMVALDEKMRDSMGPTTGEVAPPKFNPKETEWKPETKEKMLKFLDNNIAIGSDMSDCLNTSTGLEQLQQCMQTKEQKRKKAKKQKDMQAQTQKP